MYEDVTLAFTNWQIGGTYIEPFNLRDEAGQPLTSTDGWTGRAEFRTTAGELVATFAVSGDRDGTIVVDANGNWTFTLPSTFTETLTPTVPVGGTSTAYGEPLNGDLEIWSATQPTVRYKAMHFRTRVYPEVTTS